MAEFAAGLLAGWLVARLSEAFQLGTRLQLGILAAVAGAALAAVVVLRKLRVEF